MGTGESKHVVFELCIWHESVCVLWGQIYGSSMFPAFNRLSIGPHKQHGPGHFFVAVWRWRGGRVSLMKTLHIAVIIRSKPDNNPVGGNTSYSLSPPPCPNTMQEKETFFCHSKVKEKKATGNGSVSTPSKTCIQCIKLCFVLIFHDIYEDCIPSK